MKQFFVCNSKIEGRGIVAGENIKKGSIITRFKGPAQFKINRSKHDALAHPDWVGVKKNIWIDPEKPQKFINHSCEPNAGVRGLTVMAIKDIREGEEITIDYSTIEGDPRWEMKCLCGKSKCRGTISSIESLTSDQFEKLVYAPSYFRRLYLKGKEEGK